MNQLYNGHRGRDRLKATVEGPTFDTSKEGAGVPVLDALASRSADGSELYVKVVNTAAGERHRPPGSNCEVSRWLRKRSGTCSRRRAWRRTTALPPPTRFVLGASSRPAAVFDVSLPPRSVSVIVLRVAGSSAAGAPTRSGQ